MLRNDPEFASKQSGRLTIFVPAVGSPLPFLGDPVTMPAQQHNLRPNETSAQNERMLLEVLHAGCSGAPPPRRCSWTTPSLRSSHRMFFCASCGHACILLASCGRLNAVICDRKLRSFSAASTHLLLFASCGRLTAFLFVRHFAGTQFSHRAIMHITLVGLAL